MKANAKRGSGKGRHQTVNIDYASFYVEKSKTSPFNVTEDEVNQMSSTLKNFSFNGFAAGERYIFVDH
jgi:hypothetical protein